MDNVANDIAISLQKQLAAVQKQLEALGVPTEDQSRPMTLAPDGGPASQAHKALKLQMVQTMQVLLLESGKTQATINKSDFDPEIHEKVQGTRRRTELTETEPERKPLVSGFQTADELYVMTVNMLQALPEAKLIEKANKLSKKELVAAILQVREDHLATA
jgi:hypothetical protein